LRGAAEQTGVAALLDEIAGVADAGLADVVSEDQLGRGAAGVGRSLAQGVDRAAGIVVARQGADGDGAAVTEGARLVERDGVEDAFCDPDLVRLSRRCRSTGWRRRSAYRRTTVRRSC
jgi:hypothetical protein